MLRRSTLTASLLLAPSLAWADTVVLAPPVAGKGVTAQQVQDLFGLMSSELEFMPGVDEVVELDPPPPSLTSTCLDSTRCLASLARDAGGTTLIAGDVAKVGSELVADMVYFDAATGTVVRRTEWTLSTEPATLVEQVPTYLRALITGQTVAQEKAEQAMDGVDFDAEESDEVDFEEAKPPPPPPPPPPRASTSTRTVNQPIAPPPPPPPPPPEPVEDEFDPSAFDFGSAAEDISFGTSPSDIGVDTEPPPRDDAPPTPPSLRYDPPPERKPPPPRYDRDEEEEEEAYTPPPRRPAPVDTFEEDEELDRAPAPASSRSSTTSRPGSKKESGYRRVYIPVRAGYASYGWYGAPNIGTGILFHFASVNLDVQVRAIGGLTFYVGIGGWIVRREAPPDKAALCPGGVCTSGLVPLRGGLLYRIDAGKVQPYLGLEGIGMSYYQPVDANNNPVGPAQWAGGARGRLGVDVMFAKNVGLELDVTLGFLSGGSWPAVDPRLPAFGFLPEVSGGLVFAF